MNQVISQAQNTGPNLIPLNKRNHRCIMAHHSSGIVEIQGYYWPRAHLRKSEPPSPYGKRDEKKVTKARRKLENYKDVPSSLRLPLEASLNMTAALLKLNQQGPSPTSEDKAPTTSPITGKPILAHRKVCLIAPGKLLPRKNHHRRSHPNKSSSTLG